MHFISGFKTSRKNIRQKMNFQKSKYLFFELHIFSLFIKKGKTGRFPLSLLQNLFEVFLRSFFYKKSDRGQGREALSRQSDALHHSRRMPKGILPMKPYGFLCRRRNPLLPSKNAGVGEFSAH